MGFGWVTSVFRDRSMNAQLAYHYRFAWLMVWCLERVPGLSVAKRDINMEK